jgi:MFS transporter, ACS family, glucarate transporter
LSSESLDYVQSKSIQPATHVRWGVMAFLCVLSFLTYFDRVCIMRVQGDIQHDLHISDQQMGYVFSAFWLAYAVFELPGGWMGDRFGARRTLTRIVLAWSLFMALSGSAVGFVTLFSYRFLFGAGEAGAYPNIARVQSRWMPVRSQGKTSGLLWLVARWGGALAPMLLGMLLRRVDSAGFRGFLNHQLGLHEVSQLAAWRLALWVCGAFGVVWVLLFLPFFRDNPAAKRSVNAAELELIAAGKDAGQMEAKPRFDRRTWKALLTSPDLCALAMFYAFGSFGWSFFVSWLPKFFKETYNLDYAQSETLVAMPFLVGGAACLVGGWLSDRIIRATGRQRFGRAVLPTIGRVVSAGSVYAIRNAHTPMQGTALMCVTMIAYDIGQGPSWAAIIDIGGVYAGTAAGFINMIGNLGGNVVQPIVGPWIFTRFGWGTLFKVYAALYLLSGAMWLLINPSRKFYSESKGAAFPVVVPGTKPSGD